MTHLVAVCGRKGEPSIAKAASRSRIGEHRLDQILHGGAPATLHNRPARHQTISACICNAPCIGESTEALYLLQTTEACELAPQG